MTRDWSTRKKVIVWTIVAVVFLYILLFGLLGTGSGGA